MIHLAYYKEIKDWIEFNKKTGADPTNYGVIIGGRRGGKTYWENEIKKEVMKLRNKTKEENMKEPEFKPLGKSLGEEIKEKLDSISEEDIKDIKTDIKKDREKRANEPLATMRKAPWEVNPYDGPIMGFTREYINGMKAEREWWVKTLLKVLKDKENDK